MTHSALTGDVAIIGMACVFPKAPDLGTFWQNIVNQVEGISDPPTDRLIDQVFDPQAEANDRIYCRRGGYLDPLPDFDPLQYGIMPVAVEGAEPEHFMALTVADAALRDAGFPDKPFDRDRCQVILGRGTFVNRGYVTLLQHGFVVDQTLRLLQQLHPELGAARLAAIKQSLKRSLPPFNSETVPGLASSVMTGIIANRLDLRGRTFTVDAACASGLIALETAVTELLAGHCDAVLVGAVQISTPPLIHMIFTQLGALSRQPALRPFDTQADGTMLGEGVGMLVLKRLDDAVQHGHRIYAVVKGVGSSSDGRAKGLLAPRVEGEVLALQRAYARADLSPATVALVEAHGTGLPLGDATEIASLREVFGARPGPFRRCALGTVKSMIGHLIPAAGVAGLIKTALALYHKTYPPTLNCPAPHPKLGLEQTPFYINTETRPWIHGATSPPRRAGVNAFGFGGINAHAVLEEYPDPLGTAVALDAVRATELVVLRADSRAGLVAQCEQLRQQLAAQPASPLADVAYAAWRQLPAGPARLAIVAETVADLADKLAIAEQRLADPARRQIKDRRGLFFFQPGLRQDGQLVFLFPGEGSQYVGMLADLCRYFPVVRSCFDRLDQAFIGHPRGFLPSDLIFPGGSEERDQAAQRLWQMHGAVDAVITADRALFRLLTEFGLRPDAIVGHSSGELMALEAAGAVAIASEAELIAHIRAGNRVIEALQAHEHLAEAQLLTVGGVDRAVIDALILQHAGQLSLAMDNCPHQFVLCGAPAVTQQAAQALARQGGLCQPLPFSRPYHTAAYEVALGPLAQFFDGLPIVPPRVPLYSCLSAARFPEAPAEIRRLAVLQWARPVRFRETIERLFDDGGRLFVEVGPRSNLTGFVNDILNGRPVLAVASNTHRRAGITQLHQLLGLLYAHGVELSLEPLFAGRAVGATAVARPRQAAPARPLLKLALGLPRMTLAEVEVERLRQAGPTAPAPVAGGVPAGTVAPTSGLPVAVPLSVGPAPAVAVPPGAAVPDELAEYLDTMDAFLAVQRQVMQSYLAGWPGTGTDPAVPAASLALTPPGAATAAAGDDSATADAAWPLAGTVRWQVPGREVIAERCLDPERDLFLKHHTLGGQVSRTDPGLLALPVLPISMALELMAEVAAHLFPQQRLVGLRAVQLHGFIAVATGSQRVQARLCRVPSDPTAAQGQLWLMAPDPADSGRLVLEGTCLFADAYPPAPAAAPLDLGSEQPPGFAPEDYYPRLLFHGPALQSVQACRRLGSHGGVFELGCPPPTGLFADHPTPALLTEPVLVDGIGQSVGLWAAGHLASDFVVFPTGFDALTLFGPPRPAGSTTQCRLQAALVANDRATIRADAELLTPAQTVHLRVEGLRHRRAGVPNLFHDFRGSRDIRLTSPWPALTDGLGNAAILCGARTDRIPASFWEADHGIWRLVLAHIVLSASERQRWQHLARPERQRTDWLLGRLAAKEAVRGLWQTRYGVDVWCADIEIGSDGYGRPQVAGQWLPAGQIPPRVSIAHTRGMAVAVAALGEATAGVGVDVEEVRPLAADLLSAAFSPQELARLPAGEPAEWPLRLWCAKEALGKALGQGLGGDPRRLVVTHLEPATGIVHLQLAPVPSTALPGRAGTTTPVRTLSESGLVAAAVVLPEPA